MYILIKDKIMKNKQRKFAVKLYLRRIKEDPNYSENQFAAEVQQYMNENFALNPLYNAYDPFSLWADMLIPLNRNGSSASSVCRSASAVCFS